MKNLLLTSAVLLGLIGSAQAAVLASTNFNSSTIGGSTNIKTNLNWVLNGLDDPGDMSAFIFGGAAQSLFNGNSFVEDIFIPGINVGNGNNSWSTNIPITVATGFDVTLTDVTFNSVSVSGSQVENVDRRNDYSVTILNPSAVSVATISVADTTAGTSAGQPLVTLNFTDVTLSDPGTYTLQIRGGDYLGVNESGNHTGLDNLSINGNVVAIPEPSALALLGLSTLAIFSRRAHRFTTKKS